MVLEHLITADSVLCNAQARSKKHCLEILSELLAQANSDIANEEIFANLIERERLGCTSLDKGIAFPHCRVKGLHNSSGALMKLSEPVDFDSPDGEPVDLVFGLMVPDEVDASNYADIGVLTGVLSQDALVTELRNATNSRDLYEALLSGRFEAAAGINQAQIS